jgi:hypothetical protein
MGILDKQIVSKLGLKGDTPVTRENALPSSQKHYSDKASAQLSTHSVLDLDGGTPEGYKNPESGTGVK